MFQTGDLLARRFRIVRALDGCGEVYEAEDVQLRVRVALRRLERIDEAMQREIQLARRLTHPNIARVFELVTADDVELLSMELLDGETLAEYLRRAGAPGKEKAREIGGQLLRGVEAAHAEGVTHGALHSDRVMLVKNADGSVRAVLVDFAFVGTMEQDQQGLDAILLELGVGRAELERMSAVVHPRRWGRWLAAAAVAALVTVAAVYREEWFSPSLPEGVARWYADGETAIADGSYAKAESLFTQVLRQAPDYAAARCRLAETLQESDQRDRARGELMKALDGRTRGRGDRLLRELTRHYLVGDWEKAIITARKRAGVVGDSMAAGDVARVLERAGRLEEARAEYEALLRRYPGQPGPMLRFARLLAGNKQQKDAVRWLDEAERLYRALQNGEGLGAVELERGNLTQDVKASVAHARKAAALAESAGSNALLIRARLLEAVRYAGTGNLQQSESMAREAVLLAEKHSLGGVAAEGLNDLAEVIFSQVNYEEAARVLEQARGIAMRFSAKRTEADVLLRMGRVFARMNQEERSRQAFAALDEAEKFFRQSGDKALLLRAIQTRGDAFRFQGKLSAAREQYERYAGESETENDRNTARISLATVHQLEGNYSTAAKMYLEVSSYYGTTGNNLLSQRYRLDHARALRLSGRMDESEAAVREVLRQDPVTPDLAERCEIDLAAIDFGRKKLDSALGRLERITEQVDRVQRKATYNFRRYDLCMKYASAAWTEKAERLCTEIAPLERASARRFLDVQDALAMVALQKRDYARAVRHAKESVRMGEEAKMQESVFFSLMLLTRAQHGAKDPQWIQTRQRTEDALRGWEKESGVETVRQSLSRWFIAEHWNAVRDLR